MAQFCGQIGSGKSEKLKEALRCFEAFPLQGPPHCDLLVWQPPGALPRLACLGA